MPSPILSTSFRATRRRAPTFTAPTAGARRKSSAATPKPVSPSTLTAASSDHAIELLNELLEWCDSNVPYFGRIGYGKSICDKATDFIAANRKTDMTNGL